MSKRVTALVLGGGGSRGAYEAGVWQALIELGITLDMVIGTSVGAINSAMIVQNELDLALQLWQELQTSMVFDIDLKKQKHLLPNDINIGDMPADEMLAYAREIILNGGAETSGLVEILRKYINEDAIRESPMEYGLVTVELPTFTPHHLFKDDIPQAKLVDYIMASASCYPAVRTYTIDDIHYIDGGYADNLPIGMAIEKGATHIIAVNLDAVGVIQKADFKKAKYLKVISSKWDLGNFLIFDTNNAKRIIDLGYMDTMKAFGRYDGFFFTFEKNTFKKASLTQADAAARVFDLDPLLVYNRNSLNEALQKSVRQSLVDMNRDIEIGHSDFKNKLKFKEMLELLTKKYSDNSLALFIAEFLKKSSGKNTVFNSTLALKLIPSQIAAAKYLIQNDLI